MKRKGGKNKGISDFIREVGDLLATVPKTEIDRLVEEANRREIPSKYLHTTYYRLRRIAQGGNTRRKKKGEATVVEILPEATPPVVRKSRSSNRVLATLEEIRKTLEASVREEEQKAEAEIERLRVENLALRGQIEENRRQLVAQTLHVLEHLAETLPGQPQVLRVVLDARERIEVREKGIPQDLPRESKTLKLPMRYAESFLMAYWKLESDTQHKVTKAIQALADHGEHAHGLNSKVVTSSLPGTPHKSWWSQAGKEVQFTWTREEAKGQSVALLVCDLVHKGETHLGYKI